jgi:hypothetical protein
VDIAQVNLIAGWVGILLGVISGATIGLFFHREDWMGGYQAYGRRMIRLGHISFFGLGFVNLFFALSLPLLALQPSFARVVSASFILGAVSMPLCCFLTAWRKPLRYLFPIPVLSVLVGVVAILIGWHST